MYKVFAPKLLQELVRTSSVRKLKGSTLSFQGLNSGAVLKFVAALGLLAAAIPLLIHPQQQDVYAAGNALCGGELDWAFTFAEDRPDSFPVVWANTKPTPNPQDLQWDRPQTELGEMPFTGKFVNALLSGHGKKACNQTQCSSFLKNWGYPMCCWVSNDTHYQDTRELRQVQTEQIDGTSESCLDQLEQDYVKVNYLRAQCARMHMCTRAPVHTCMRVCPQVPLPRFCRCACGSD